MSRRDAGEVPSDPAAAVRQAILRIAERRHAVAADAGRALVTHTQVTRALTQQRATLEQARYEIESAIETAQRAADSARADAASPSDGDAALLTSGVAGQDAATAGELAAAPYEQARAGLERQLDVIDAAARQLTDLDSDSAVQIARGRELLRENLRSLDAALGEQLRLLTQVERAERVRLVAQARAHAAALRAEAAAARARGTRGRPG